MREGEAIDEAAFIALVRAAAALNTGRGAAGRAPEAKKTLPG